MPNEIPSNDLPFLETIYKLLKANKNNFEEIFKKCENDDVKIDAAFNMLEALRQCNHLPLNRNQIKTIAFHYTNLKACRVEVTIKELIQHMKATKQINPRGSSASIR